MFVVALLWLQTRAEYLKHVLSCIYSVVYVRATGVLRVCVYREGIRTQIFFRGWGLNKLQLLAVLIHPLVMTDGFIVLINLWPLPLQYRMTQSGAMLGHSNLWRQHGLPAVI